MDPVPGQNVTDPEHCKNLCVLKLFAAFEDPPSYVPRVGQIATNHYAWQTAN